MSIAAGQRWTHVKRGTTYEVIGIGELQMSADLVDGSSLVIYRGDDGKLWAREEGEFLDGRFEPSRMTPTNDAPVTVEREYRKTATIRAVQWWKMGDHPAVIMASDVIGATPEKPLPFCPTLEGGHVVTPGDWIATGVQGEHWPIKPDVFAATYSPVEPVMDFGEAIDPNASHNLRRPRHRLAAALASAPAGDGVEDGWQLVPVDLTQSMVDAVQYPGFREQGVRSAWSELLAAAPKALARPRAAVGKQSREAIARIIDPDAFATYPFDPDRCEDFIASIEQAAEDALAKADDIIALQSLPAKE